MRTKEKRGGANQGYLPQLHIAIHAFDAVLVDASRHFWSGQKTLPPTPSSKLHIFPPPPLLSFFVVRLFVRRRLSPGENNSSIEKARAIERKQSGRRWTVGMVFEAQGQQWERHDTLHGLIMRKTVLLLLPGVVPHIAGGGLVDTTIVLWRDILCTHKSVTALLPKAVL